MTKIDVRGEQRKGTRKVAAPHHPDVNEIFAKLRVALHHGARKNRLYKQGRCLIDLLIPSDCQTDESYSLRAVQAEHLIRLAIKLLNPPDSDALRLCLALESEAIALQPLERRRQQAAQLYGVLPDTFRLRHEGALLFDLAFQIFTILIGADGPGTPEECTDATKCPNGPGQGA